MIWPACQFYAVPAQWPSPARGRQTKTIEEGVRKSTVKKSKKEHAHDSARGDIKMALVSLRGARWRSTLTMLGIVFGVLSVVTVVGIGEGVKQQIGQEVSQFGKNLITIRPGHVSNANSLSTLQNADLLFGLNSISGLSEQDLGAVQSSSHVAFAAPLGMVPGTVSVRRTARQKHDGDCYQFQLARCFEPRRAVW